MKTKFRVQKLIILLAIFAFATSCTMSYKSSKLRKSYNKNYKQVKKVSKSMKKDFSKRKGIYDGLNLEYDNYLAKKKPKITILLNKMSKVINKLESEKKNSLTIKDEVYRLTKNRKKIKSNKPEWEEYNKIEDKTVKLHARVEGLISEYESLSQKYNDLLKSSNVKKVSARKLKRRFKKNSQKLSKTVMKFENEVNKLLVRYSNDTDKVDKLDKIKDLLKNIREEWKTTRKLIELFNLRLGNKKKIYIIENQDDVIKRIKRSYGEVTRLGTEINKISKKL